MNFNRLFDLPVIRNYSKDKLISTFFEFIKYGVVGLLNTVVHFIIFITALHFDLNQATSNLFGFIVAVSFSFILNSLFTFNAKPTFSRYLKMVCIMAVISYGFGFLGDSLSFHPLVTFVVYCGCSYIISFTLVKKFVYAK